MRCTKYNAHFDRTDRSDWWKHNCSEECSSGCLECEHQLRDSAHDPKSTGHNNWLQAHTHLMVGTAPSARIVGNKE